MNDDLPLAIIQDGNKPAKLAPERFKNAGDCRTYCDAMISANETRAEARARTENVLNGARPIPESKLREKGMAFYPNVNHRGLEGYIDTPRTAFYDLVTEVDPCVEIYLDYGQGTERQNWQDTIAKHFTWLLLSRWRLGFNFHVQLQQREMLVHGIGAHVWPQMPSGNWFPRTPKTGHLLFPEGTSVDFEHEGEAFLLRDFVPIWQLYSWVKNDGAADKRGWNSKTVWEVMAKMTKRQMRTNDDLDHWVRAQKSGGDIGSISQTTGVWLNWLFVREIDTQQISLYGLADGYDTDKFLFKRRNLYENWPLALFPYDIGNGDIHSIRGLGERCRSFFELDNQIKNSMTAQVLLQNTMPLKQTGSIDPSKLKLTKMGMLSILPQNVEVAQGFKFPDLNQGPIALWRELQMTLRQNNDPYLTGSPDAKDRETATSYVMRSQDSAQITKGTHGLYGSHLCLFYEKVFRMVVKSARKGSGQHAEMAKEFMRRCTRDGVPSEAFDHVEEIVEVMSTGAGSAAARLQALMMLMNTVFPNTTDDRKINMLRDLTSVAVSGAKVDRYAPSLSDNDTSDSDDSIITLENNDLTEGQLATVTDRQNHVRHAQRHLQAAGEVYQGIGQSEEPEEGLKALMAIGRHTAEHLDRLKANPTKQAEYKELNGQLQQLANAAKQLQQQVEAAAEQEPPEQMMSEKGQIGMMKVQQDAALKREKLAAEAQLNFDKARFQQRLDDSRTAAEIRRKAVAA